MMRLDGRWLMGVTVFGLCAAVVVRAQEAPAPERKDMVEFSLKTGAEFTDNRDSAENDEESNVDLFLSPKVTLNVQSTRSLLDFYYAPSLRYRSDASEFQNDQELFHDLSAGLRHDLTERWLLRMRENFQYIDDPSLEEGGFTVRRDETFIRNRFEAGLRLRASEYAFADLSGYNEIKRYDEAVVADDSDEDRTSAQLTLWRQVAPTVALVGLGGYTMYGFESSRNIERDFDAILGALGVDKVFSPALRAGVRAGAQSLQHDDAGLDDEVYPYGELLAYYTPNPASRVNGRVGMGARDADVYPFSSQEYQEVHVRGEWDTSPMWTWGLSGTYRTSTYDDASRPSSAPADAFEGSPDGDEDTLVLRADVALAVNNRSRLRFAQTYEDVSSDVAASFTKNTSMVSYEITF